MTLKKLASTTALLTSLPLNIALGQTPDDFITMSEKECAIEALSYIKIAEAETTQETSKHKYNILTQDFTKSSDDISATIRFYSHELNKVTFTASHIGNAPDKTDDATAQITLSYNNEAFLRENGEINPLGLINRNEDFTSGASWSLHATKDAAHGQWATAATQTLEHTFSACMELIPAEDRPTDAVQTVTPAPSTTLR